MKVSLADMAQAWSEYDVFNVLLSTLINNKVIQNDQNIMEFDRWVAVGVAAFMTDVMRIPSEAKESCTHDWGIMVEEEVFKTVIDEYNLEYDDPQEEFEERNNCDFCSHEETCPKTAGDCLI